MPAQEAFARANSNAGQNVYLAMDQERILAEAEALSARFPEPEQRPPLFGVPVAVKDCFDVAGYPTTCGSHFYAEKNGIAAADSTVAARLRQAGAVIMGKTHLHQLAYGITGENNEYGDCLQPRESAGTHRRLVQRKRGQRAGGLGGCRDRHRYRRLHPRAGGALRVGRLSLYARTRRRARRGRAGGIWLFPSTPWDGFFAICAMGLCWLRRCSVCRRWRRRKEVTIAAVGEGLFWTTVSRRCWRCTAAGRTDLRRHGAQIDVFEPDFWSGLAGDFRRHPGT